MSNSETRGSPHSTLGQGTADGSSTSLSNTRGSPPPDGEEQASGVSASALAVGSAATYDPGLSPSPPAGSEPSTRFSTTAVPVHGPEGLMSTDDARALLDAVPEDESGLAQHSVPGKGDTEGCWILRCHTCQGRLVSPSRPKKGCRYVHHDCAVLPRAQVTFAIGRGAQARSADPGPASGPANPAPAPPPGPGGPGDAPALSGPKPCTMYSKTGQCKWGRKCKYAHLARPGGPGTTVDELADAAATIAGEARTARLVARKTQEAKRLKGFEGGTAAAAIAAQPISAPAMDVPARVRDDFDLPREAPQPGVEVTGPADWCPSVVAGGRCPDAGCTLRHGAGVALPTLAEGAHDPGQFRIVKERYTDNPENAHLREFEPLGDHERGTGAWGTYLVPTVDWVGVELAFSATGTAAARMYKQGFGRYVDRNRHRRVVLLRHVVDSMRTYFAHSARSGEAAEFYIGAHRAVRLCANIRMTAGDVLTHKHYATLYAYYACDTNDDGAAVARSYVGGGFTRAASQFLASLGVGVPSALSAGIGGFCGAAFLAMAYDADRSRRELARLREVQLLASRPVALGDVLGSLLGVARGARMAPIVAAARSAGTRARGAAERALEDGRRSLDDIDRELAKLDQAERKVIKDAALGAYVLFGAPLLEETFKHTREVKGVGSAATDRVVTALITAWETSAAVVAAVQSLSVRAGLRIMGIRMLVNVMHYLTYRMPFRFAFPVHSLWNGVAARHLQQWHDSFDRTLLDENQPPVTPPVPAPAGPALTATGALGVGALRAVVVTVSVVQSIFAHRAALRMAFVRTWGPRFAWLRARWQAQQRSFASPGFVISDAAYHSNRGRLARPVVAFEGEENAPAKLPDLGVGVEVQESMCDTKMDEDTNLGRLATQGELGSAVAHGIPSNVDPTRRVGAVQYGFGMGDFRPTYPARTMDNLRGVAVHRVGKSVPVGTFEDLADLTAFIMDPATSDALIRWPGGARVRRVRCMSTARWLDQVGSSPEVKAMLRRTWKEMQSQGIGPNTPLTRGYLKRVLRGRKIFVKREGLSLRSHYGLAAKAYRPIFPTHPEVLILTGPWCASFQGMLFKCWNKEFFITMSGKEVSMAELGEFVFHHWLAGWKLLEDDCGAWDMSFNELVAPLHRAYTCLYRRLGCPVATYQVYVVLFGSHTGWMVFISIRKTYGTQFSGLGDTLVKNGEHNAFVHVYIIVRTVQRPLAEVSTEVKMAVAGDDNVAAVKDTIPTIDWTAQMARLGHNADGLYRATPADAGFCSAVFLPSSTGPRLTPLPGRAISRNGYYCDPPRNVEREQLVRGSALSNYEAMRHVPPVRALYDRLLTLTRGHKPVFPSKLAHRALAGEGAECTAETWESLNHRYPEWDPAVQRDWETYLAGLELGDEITFPAALAMASRDSDGPKAPGDPCGGPSYLPGGDAGGQPCLYELGPADWAPLTRCELATPRPGGPIWPSWTAEDWALSAKKRNKLAHAANGNTSLFGASSTGLVRAVVAGALAGGLAAGLAGLLREVEMGDDTVQVLLSDPTGKTLVVELRVSAGKSAGRELLSTVARRTGLPPSEFFVCYEGRTIMEGDTFPVPEGSRMSLFLRVRGGSGRGRAKSAKKGARERSGSRKGGSRKKGPRIVVVPRTAQRIQGHGDYIVPTSSLKYKVDGQSAGHAVGSALGAAAGGMGGRALGGFLGDTIHRGFKYFTGHGDYRTRNSELNHRMKGERSVLLSGRLPQFGKKEGELTIAFEECVGLVYSSTGFTCRQYRINPGLASTFPWLAARCRGYTQYTASGIIFNFRSSSGSSLSNTLAMGMVGLGTKYDPGAGPFPDLRSAENSEYTTVGKPSEDMLHLIECDRRKGAGVEARFIRGNNATTVEDARENDLGVLNVMTFGNPDSATLLGELWVTYQFTLYKPVSSGVEPGRFWMAQTTGASGQPAYPVAPLAASTLPVSVFPLNDGMNVRMPKLPGKYLMVANAGASSTLAGSFNISGFSADVTMARMPDTAPAGTYVLPGMANMLTANTAVLVYYFDYAGNITSAVNDFYLNLPSATNGITTTNIMITSVDASVGPPRPLNTSLLLADGESQPVPVTAPRAAMPPTDYLLTVHDTGSELVSTQVLVGPAALALSAACGSGAASSSPPPAGAGDSRRSSISDASALL